MLTPTFLTLASVITTALAIPFNHNGQQNSQATVPTLVCAKSNDENIVLAGSVIREDLTVCFYHGIPQSCQYTTADGQTFQGGSICPDTLVEHVGASTSTTHKSSPVKSVTGIVNSRFECAAVDDNGSPLLASGFEAGAQNVECDYEAAGSCEYFEGNGTFSSGGSTCPNNLVLKGVAATPSAPAAPVVTPSPVATPVAAPLNSRFECPAVDDVGSPLLASGFDAGAQQVECRYEDAGSCDYFEGNGTFSSGGSTCPGNLVLKSAPPLPTPTPIVNAASKFVCAPVDDNGSLLLASSLDAGFLECDYEGAGQCDYFIGNGTFSAGGSTCPSGLVAA